MAVLLILLCLQDRARFDELVRGLDDEAIEAREAAARALADFPPEADAWLAEAIERSEGERKARLRSVAGERAARRENAGLRRLGISEKLLRACPDLSRRLAAEDPAERLLLLEELSGWRLPPDEEDPDDADEIGARYGTGPRELGIVAELALRKPASKRLLLQIAVLQSERPSPWLVGALRKALREGDPAVRTHVIEYLYRLEADLTPLAPELLQLLVDGDSETAESVADSLSGIAWEAHFDALLDALRRMGQARAASVVSEAGGSMPERMEPRMRLLVESPHAPLRALAAEYYRYLGHIEPPETLVKLLDDSEGGIRVAALEALRGRLPRERLLKMVGQDDLHAQALDELVRLRAPEAVELVRAELRAGDNRQALSWAETLAEPALLEAAEGFRHGEYRLGWVQFVLAADRKRGLDELRKFLEDEPPDGMRAAAPLYVRSGGPDALDMIGRLSKSGDAQTRLAAIDCLEEVGGRRAMEDILKFAHDKDDSVRAHAVSTLSHWDDPEVVDRLLELPPDQMYNSTLGSMLSWHPFPRDGKRLREALLEAHLQAGAAQALLALETQEARQAVEAQVAKWGVDELERLPAEVVRRLPAARERAAALWKDETRDEHRFRLDKILAEHGDAAAAGRAAEFAVEMGEIGSHPAAHLLAPDLRKRCVEEVLAWARVLEPERRSGLLGRCVWVGFDEALVPLLEAARADANVCGSYAAMYLPEADPAKVLPLVRPMIASSEPSDRRLAAYCIGRFGGAEDRDRLRPLLRDPSVTVRAQAAESLADLEAVESAGEIGSLLDDKAARVRAAAAEALGVLRRGPIDKLRTLSEDEALNTRAILGDVTCAEAYIKQSAYGEGMETLAKAGCKPLIEHLRARLARNPDTATAKALALAGESHAVAWLRKRTDVDSAIALLETGNADDPATLLERLTWASEARAGALLLALNRLTDAKRYEALREKWTPARWVGPKASDHAQALADLLGLPVKADASVRDRAEGAMIAARCTFQCALGAVPVFEGEGITLYSWQAARKVWRERLKK